MELALPNKNMKKKKLRDELSFTLCTNLTRKNVKEYEFNFLDVTFVVLFLFVSHRAHLDSFPFQLVCLATFLNVSESESDNFDPYQVFHYPSFNVSLIMMTITTTIILFLAF